MSEALPGLYLGTQGFSYPSWVGAFYPEGTASTRFLEHYATQFNTVELDTTFYGAPRASTVARWRDQTPDGFRFAAKFPQAITHQKALIDCGVETRAFLMTMDQLGSKLGPLLLQMPPSWTSEGFAALAAYLPGLDGFRVALEVRHRSWLSKETTPRLLELLERHGVALTLTQLAGMPALDQLTAQFTYIRWLGRRQDIPDDDYSHVRINRDAQLDGWASQISRYLREGVTIHAYFNNHHQGHSPASARSLLARLEALDAREPD